jgi:hypothetical protein
MRIGGLFKGRSHHRLHHVSHVGHGHGSGSGSAWWGILTLVIIIVAVVAIALWAKKRWAHGGN